MYTCADAIHNVASSHKLVSKVISLSIVDPLVKRYARAHGSWGGWNGYGQFAVTGVCTSAPHRTAPHACTHNRQWLLFTVAGSPDGSPGPWINGAIAVCILCGIGAGGQHGCDSIWSEHRFSVGQNGCCDHII